MRTTVRLDDDLAAHVDAIRCDADDSDAEAVREAIRRSKRVDQLEAQIDDLEREVERHQNQNQQILAQRDENTELRKFAQEHRTEVQKQQQYREAGIVTKLKWTLTGMPSDDGDD